MSEDNKKENEDSFYLGCDDDEDYDYDYLKMWCRENDLEFVTNWFSNKNNIVTQEQLNELFDFCFCEDYGYEVAKFLLNKGADINVLNRSYTLLCSEVSSQKEAYNEFIYNNNDSSNKLSVEEARKNGRIIGKIDGIKFLLENGADPNILDFLGKTPLDDLLDNTPKEYLFIEAIELLKQYGAKTSEELKKEGKFKFKKEDYSIFIEKEHSSDEILRKHIEEEEIEKIKDWFNNSKTKLTQEEIDNLFYLSLIQKDNKYLLDISKIFLEKGARINQVYLNKTLLQIICHLNNLKPIYGINRSIDGIKFLLENGADPNLGNYDGKKTLDMLIEDDNHDFFVDEAIKLLRQYGAKTAKELENK